ncbi:hypothetical protein BT93_G0367 [Corymbia citriodora subsp. variegata]|nr:hypothetical protein BT93_G0367 [Corymbia citriodora subsp. variegata]
MVDEHFQQQTQQAAESDGERSAAQVKFREESLNFPAGGGSSDELIESGTFELNFISSDDDSCSPLVCSSEADDDDVGSLIEISLPSKVCSDDFSPKPIFEKQEVTAEDEINEEDNLIELDISMGSIRCSKFEI